MTAATISVVSHGHGKLLHGLLLDLCEQRGVENCQVVVTLNLADESFDPAVYPALRITVIRNVLPKGFGANHNAAFQHCDKAWFIVVNPDIRLPDRQALTALLQEPRADKKVGLRAPLVFNSSGKPEDSVRHNLSPWSLLRRFVGDRQPLRPEGPACEGRPYFWLAGMLMAVDSEAFRQIGGFDERFFLYCEDYDLCARLYVAGYALVLDDQVQVVHDAQRDSHRSYRHFLWHITSLLKVWRSSVFWRITLRSLWMRN